MSSSNSASFCILIPTVRYETRLLNSDPLTRAREAEGTAEEEEAEQPQEKANPRYKVDDLEIVTAAMSSVKIDKPSNAQETKNSAEFMRAFRVRNARKASKQMRREKRAEKQKETAFLDSFDKMTMGDSKVKKPARKPAFPINPPPAPRPVRHPIVHGREDDDMDEQE